MKTYCSWKNKNFCTIFTEFLCNNAESESSNMNWIFTLIVTCAVVIDVLFLAREKKKYDRRMH